MEKYPGYILLVKKPSENSYSGIVEGSFALDSNKDRTRFFWTGVAYFLGNQYDIDGKKDAQEMMDYYLKKYPDWEIEMFDVENEDLPVTIDWEQWFKDNEPNPNTLSGVKNKFGARNVKFEMKD